MPDGFVGSDRVIFSPVTDEIREPELGPFANVLQRRYLEYRRIALRREQERLIGEARGTLPSLNAYDVRYHLDDGFTWGEVVAREMQPALFELSPPPKPERRRRHATTPEVQRATRPRNPHHAARTSTQRSRRHGRITVRPTSEAYRAQAEAYERLVCGRWDILQRTIDGRVSVSRADIERSRERAYQFGAVMGLGLGTSFLDAPSGAPEANRATVSDASPSGEVVGGGTDQ